MRPATLWQSLCRPEAFHATIDRLTRDQARGDGTGERALLRRERGELCAKLARAIADRSWRQVAVERRMVVLDKPREVVALSVVDRVMHGAIATALAARIEADLPASLYSYRVKRGPRHAIAEILAMVARYRQRRDIPLVERGLFALRFDVAKYGDSVRVGADSELWPLLRAAIPDEDPWMLALIEELTRCDAGAAVPRELGVPTGSPLANPLLNLYLSDLDRRLESMTELYVRFGDDCFAIAASEPAAIAARDELHAILARKGLTTSAPKFLQAYWNSPGRPGPPGWRGASHIAYVGADIGFDGTVRLKRAHRRELIAEMTARIVTVAQFVEPASTATPDDVRARARMLCEALRPMFEPASPFALAALAGAVVMTTCREQLAQMDREIAMTIASVASGRRGPAAFRVVPWRSLYELGLPSLVGLRNHGWA